MMFIIIPDSCDWEEPPLVAVVGFVCCTCAFFCIQFHIEPFLTLLGWVLQQSTWSYQHLFPPSRPLIYLSIVTEENKIFSSSHNFILSVGKVSLSLSLPLCFHHARQDAPGHTVIITSLYGAHWLFMCGDVC